jgi:hypothetical protein
VSPASDRFDIAFIGHVRFDEVIAHQGALRSAPGGAVRCGLSGLVHGPRLPRSVEIRGRPGFHSDGDSRPVCRNPEGSAGSNAVKEREADHASSKDALKLF